jgi:excisionase family DNA binding protein
VPPEGFEQWLDAAAIAEMLQTTRAHVYGLLERREITAYKFGQLVRVKQSDFDRYLARQRTPALVDGREERPLRRPKQLPAMTDAPPPEPPKHIRPNRRIVSRANVHLPR